MREVWICENCNKKRSLVSHSKKKEGLDVFCPDCDWLMTPKEVIDERIENQKSIYLDDADRKRIYAMGKKNSSRREDGQVDEKIITDPDGEIYKMASKKLTKTTFPSGVKNPLINDNKNLFTEQDMLDFAAYRYDYVWNGGKKAMCKQFLQDWLKMRGKIGLVK